MAARSEHGAPSALTVLEVAEGLRWTDPALGASLAEHVRRVAADDPAVRAAADRSLLRSLVESDRHEDAVERGVPLLTEARDRGDHDDGAAVLVELAVAATGLGDPGLARRLLDRLGSTDELPARVGAAACAARAEACATQGDVSASDAAGDEATPTLFRVPQPDSAVLRARIALARGVARRRAGDADGALSVLDAVVSADPAGDVDGGRRSMTAAAEESELLVEVGRHGEAVDRARRVLPDGTPGPHIADAVGRIRLAAHTASGGGAQEATSIAEELETAGRIAGAARAWDLAAALAEAEGDLGRALAALRRGHALASAARDAADRALRALAAVADGAEPLATNAPPPGDGTSAPAERNGRAGRRRRRELVEGDPFPTPGPERLDADRAITTAGTAGNETAPDVENVSVPPPPLPTTAAPERVSPRDVAPERATSETRPPRDEATAAPEPGPSRSTRDELAELLASLTRSMDSSRASVSAMGLEPAPPGDPAPTDVGDGRAPQPEPGLRSRHSAPPLSGGPMVAEATAVRPTFDAFSTAPTREAGAGHGKDASATVAPLPDDRFAPAEGTAPDGPAPQESWSPAPPASVSSLVDPLADPLADPFEDSSLPVEREGAASDDEVVAVPGPPVASSWDLPAPPIGETAAADGRGDSAATPGAEVDAVRFSAESPPEVERGRGVEAAPPMATTSTPPAATDDGAHPTPDRGATSDSSSTSVHQGGAATSGPAATPDRPDVRAHERGSTGRTGPSDAGRATGREDGTRAAGGSRADERARGRTPSPGPRDRRDAVSTATSVGRAPTSRAADEYDEDLALTLATVLGEYHLPDVPVPPRAEHVRPPQPAPSSTGTPGAGDVAVPSARRHTSGSMPLPADQRWAPRPEGAAGRPDDGSSEEGRRNGSGANGRGRPPESGERLADLLAEAMDAFRHVGPESQEGSRGPGVGSRRA